MAARMAAVGGPARAEEIGRRVHVTPRWRHRAGGGFADTAHLSANPPARKSFSLHPIRSAKKEPTQGCRRDEAADLVSVVIKRGGVLVAFSIR